MKKFFSLIAAVLFAGSMMAQVTITPGDFTETTSADYSTVKEGVTVAVTASTVTADQIRIFKTQTITISAESNITSIEFTCTANGTAKYGPGCFNAQEGYTYDAAGNTGTWTGSATSVTFTAESNQVRATQIVVTLEGSTPVVTDTYTVAGNDAAIFGEAWNPALATNDMKKVNGIYKWEKAELNLAVGTIEFKVVKNHSWDIAYPAQNYVVNIAEAGEYTLTITFDPATEAVAAEAVKKVIPKYEVAEAIAAGLAEGDEVLVRGVISKMQIKGKNFAKYGSVNIFVTDATGAEGEFEFFNCFSFNADTFRTTTPAYDAEGTTWEDLKKVADENGNEFRLGDTIVAFGKYKLYNTTHELTACYITDLKQAPVKPAQTIEVNMSEGLRFVDYVAAEGWWELYGDDGKYIIDLSNVLTEQIAGEYPIDNLDPDYRYLGIINGEDTTYVTFVGGAITLTVSENGDVTVTGTLVGDDDNNYVLNLAYVVPTAKEEVSVSIADGELYDEYADYGLYAIFGETETVYVQLAIWAENGFEGNFTEEDLDGQNIGSFIYDGEEYVEIYSATITVTPADGGGYNIVATILGYNNKQYTIAMTIPAQEEGIEETLAAGKAAKVLRDGQVLILKGDKTFNVMGTVVR